MNPTRDIITDLLPLYFSGEASADTRALVEEFFAQDPDFERMARRLATGLNTLKAAAPGGPEDLEKRALMRTRAELRGKNISLGMVLAGLLAIVLLAANEGSRHSASMTNYPLIVLACVAILAILARRTRNTGL